MMKWFFLIGVLLLQACATAPKTASDDKVPVLEEWKRVMDDPKQVHLLQATPLFQRNSRWRCVLDKQVLCSSGKCADLKPDAWIQLDFKAKTYERCNNSQCISQVLDCVQSGIYSCCAPKGNNQGFLKIMNDGSSFVEVVAFGLTSVNAFGKCVEN